MSSAPPPVISIEEQCELGQQQLMAMDYLASARTLSIAARRAEIAHDYALLSRILLPLQEAHRQRRQRAGEGMVCLDLIADDQLTPVEIIRRFPCGQLLVAAHGSIQPALEVRRLQNEQNLYLDTFLGAFYSTDSGPVIAVVPLPHGNLPPAVEQGSDRLIATLPPHTLLVPSNEFPSGRRTGTAETFSNVIRIWERLHAPFLAAADGETDPMRKIAAYQKTIEVDYACELAHQRLAEVVHSLSRK